MTSTGSYTLTVSCDLPGCDKADNYEPMNAVFNEPTKMEAIARARESGWMIKRNCRTRCPSHAAELRANHWREKRAS